ncbi:unnamed protein product [Hymenolepis diminuta]|uniref:Uncharacterized protein n=1 Tax=Hymenolepis diminuta TaxID=6216 RepID=A0A564ZET6_HYMDI|nr:unnamed protein product [Hymenolepis diminuta]
MCGRGLLYRSRDDLSFKAISFLTSAHGSRQHLQHSRDLNCVSAIAVVGVFATGNLLEARFHTELELIRRCKQMAKASPNARKRMSFLSPGSYSLA